MGELDTHLMPNSHKFKAEEKAKRDEKPKAKPVVSSPVQTKKKSGLKSLFISDDTKNVKSYIVQDILVPMAKKTISEVITTTVDIIFYGGTGKAKNNGSRFDKVSYRDCYDRPRNSERREEPRTSSSVFDYDDFKFETRSDAEAVLRQMGNILDKYGYTTVLDLYDSVERTAPFGSAKYGWMSLSNAEVVRLIGGGYTIKFPKAQTIE